LEIVSPAGGQGRPPLQNVNFGFTEFAEKEFTERGAPGLNGMAEPLLPIPLNKQNGTNLCRAVLRSELLL